MRAITSSHTRSRSLLMTTATERSDRRKFLKQTTMGFLFLSAGGARGLAIASQHRPSPELPTLVFFSDQEYQIVQAIAQRIIGPHSQVGLGKDKTDVAFRADRYLAGADIEIQEQFHQLLVVFNAPVFTFLFDFRFSSFLDMSAQAQDTYLLDWMTSMLAFRRTAFQALKRLCTSMYYTDGRSWAEIEYGGMFLPEERP